MKSYHIFKNNSEHKSFIFEDKSERIERREERRKERREKKFTQEGEDFNLNKFIQVLSALKNSIVSKMTECQNRRLSEKEGKKTGEKYMGIFSKHDERVSLLLEEARYRKAQGEGKYLEAADDKATIDRFRKEYESLKKDFSDTEKKFQDELNIEQEEIIENIKYGSIRKPLSEAKEFFKKADEIYNNLEIIRKAEEASISAASKQSTSSRESIEIKETIKSGKEPKDKEEKEQIKKVYKSICDNWKEYKPLIETAQWKKSFFCDPKDNVLRIGPNRTFCIKAIKTAYGIKTLSGDITPELVKALQENGVIKESINFNSNSKMLLSFSDFLSKKSKISEGLNLDAMKEFIKSGGSSSSGESKEKEKEKSKESWESPFKDREEGNAFRKWVNENDPELAKKIDLDKEGSHTNSYIRRAWKELGEIYLKYKEQKKAGEESKAKAEAKAKIEDKAKKDAAAKKAKGISEKQAKEIAKKILVAMSGFTEDDDEIERIFKKEIKDKETYDAVDKAWGLFSPDTKNMRRSNVWQKVDAQELFSGKYKMKDGIQTLKALFKKYFTTIDEMQRLRRVLPKGVDI